jgi:cysteine synthase A
MLRLCGAELREVPAVPYKDPSNYVHVSERLAKEMGAFWANQWDNTANRDGHYRSTGPEIWEQTDGRVDGFTCAIGTGGTLAGVSKYLKEKNPRIRIVAADPMGAAMYSWFKLGELKAEGSSVTEGIGLGRVTKNVEGAQVDDAYQIPDSEALPLMFDLLKNEGLCVGGSSAINVAGAIRLARELGPGRTVVTILADSGTRYQSKLFSRAFLTEKGLPAPDWL